MLEEDFFQVGLFSIRVGLFLARGGLFSIGVGLFLVGGGLFLSPTVAEKSPTPAEKSPTAILKRCRTLEYFGELEFSSPFMEQWTLDARGVLFVSIINFSLFQVLKDNVDSIDETGNIPFDILKPVRIM